MLSVRAGERLLDAQELGDVVEVDDAGEAAGAGDADEPRVSEAWTVARSVASGVETSAVRAGSHHLLDAAGGAEVVQAAQERGLGQDAGDAARRRARGSPSACRRA